MIAQARSSLTFVQLAGLLASTATLLSVSNADTGIRFGHDIARISSEFNSVFPAGNFNRNVSTTFWQTSVLVNNSNVQSDLNRILNVSFIAYDDSFYQLLGVAGYESPKQLEIIFKFPPKPAFATRQVHDGTVYAPEAKAIFFAELHVPSPGYSADAMPWVWRIDLSNQSNPQTTKVYPSPQLTIPNGAYYHNGSVFWAQEGNYTNPGGVVRMDPITLKTQVVQNNFYGHRFNSPNDIVITKTGATYFTDGYYGTDNFNDSLPALLANGIWRWDQKTGNIRQVAGAAEQAFFNPNGLALSATEDKLYITNRGKTSDDPAGGRTIYRYDVTTAGIKNREVFAYVDAGFPDGVKTDRDGRVYGAVTGGVDVFNVDGILIGRIKVANGDTAVNMVFVGNWLYIVGRDNAYRVKLNTTAV
ncbi:Uncharacterized protein BP5553_07825 [Venustampulla echinocandica]|uniref:SMP-30/Gluconolactonase/LRE-like region domain-containing protein n=1 Tax=Venustampulla echinocandica TaxID=2656787 RepID=A0A370THM1_9HELO|nr:Uncharacterized protein BP5553_07825 [Venustampulla echinocandica]RDL34697.1 Uncharacterized protein BP5553_07825 [Venustampulla echinocandica]